MPFWFWIIVAVALLFLVAALILFFSVRYFFHTTIVRKPTATLEHNIPANTNWEIHLAFIRERGEWLKTQTKEDVYITSHDGLKLHGTLVQCPQPSKRIVICFHGYTSCGLNDYKAISKFYIENNFHVLMPDARAHGESEGKYAGFGVLDRFDAKQWIGFAMERFGNDSVIFLHGTSMGASTVLMASNLDLPENVKTIIADCGFTSAYDVFSYILKRDYHIPKFPIMNLTERKTKKLAGYGYNDVSTLNEVAKTNIPILFIHGEDDDFVPTWMTEKNFAACHAPKELLMVKHADHAESYYVNTKEYEQAIARFIDKYADGSRK